MFRSSYHLCIDLVTLRDHLFDHTLAFRQTPTDIFRPRNEDSLKLPGLELDETAGIDAPAGRTDVTAQVGDDCHQIIFGQRFARIKSVGDVDVPGLDVIADKGRCTARHVGAEDRGRRPLLLPVPLPPVGREGQARILRGG